MKIVSDGCSFISSTHFFAITSFPYSFLKSFAIIPRFSEVRGRFLSSASFLITSPIVIIVPMDFIPSRADDLIKIDDIKERDEREAEFGLKEVIENSDYKINNNSTITDLQEKTRKIILKIIMESSNLF
ncbi:hypothetical protein ES703_83210 [subsurface metagenome]